jgi:hypothetical protein
MLHLPFEHIILRNIKILVIIDEEEQFQRFSLSLTVALLGRVYSLKVFNRDLSNDVSQAVFIRVQRSSVGDRGQCRQATITVNGNCY